MLLHRLRRFRTKPTPTALDAARLSPGLSCPGASPPAPREEDKSREDSFGIDRRKNLKGSFGLTKQKAVLGKAMDKKKTTGAKIKTVCGQPARDALSGRFAPESVPAYDYMLRVRMYKEDHAELREKAAQTGLTVSEYVRRKSLGKVVKSRTDERMVAELCRVGGLLKHVHVESGGAYSQTTAEMLHELRNVIAMISREVRENDK